MPKKNLRGFCAVSRRMDRRMDDGRKVIAIAHPEQSSGELKIDYQSCHCDR